jgi:prepilin-type N-terminal cleavage/methylation domain-containing protein
MVAHRVSLATDTVLPAPSRCPSQTRRVGRRARARGFNLLEVMIASTILIVGATGIFMGMTSSTQSEQRMHHLAVASQVLESVLENLLSLPPQHPWLAPGLHNSGDAPLYFDASGVPTVADGAVYHVIWEVSSNQTAKAVLNGIHRVDVQARWESGGHTQSTSLQVHRR